MSGARITLQTLRERKAAGQRFSCLTVYDASCAALAAAAGIEVLLVGDSLGMTVQGRDDTLGVTLADIAYHLRCARRGKQNSLLAADLPLGSYATPAQAAASATELARAGAEVVKLEGGRWLAEQLRLIVRCGIPVCAHLGLCPQSVHLYGGYRRQGTHPEQAAAIAADALALEEAGASLLVLECVPTALAGRISRQLSIPVIGIGAGPDTDGQVLVLQDALGMSEAPPPFARDFLRDADGVAEAMAAYRAAVLAGEFPPADDAAP